MQRQPEQQKQQQIQQQKNNQEVKERYMIYFQQKPSNEKKLSLLTVYTQTITYYDSLFTPLIISIQLLIFIYKHNILFYQSNIIAGEIILLVLGFFINNWRIKLGIAGNKGKKYSSVIMYIILSVLILIGFVYIVAIQANILWLEFISFILGLIFVGIELLFMIIVTIANKITQ